MEAKKEGGGVGARLHFCISQKELGFAKQLRRIKMQSFLQVDGAIVSMQPCSLAFLRAVGERGENDVAAFYPLGKRKNILDATLVFLRPTAKKGDKRTF